MSRFPLSEKQFHDIYSLVPRLTIEIVLLSDKGIYLTQRNIEPCKDVWHLPGGTVHFGEPLVETVRRIAKRELGVTVTDTALLGYIEYPSHYLKGLDSPVGITFQITGFSGKIKHNKEAQQSGWFKHLPEVTHEGQLEFILSHNLLSSSSPTPI